jgi:hypothetical protein
MKFVNRHNEQFLSFMEKSNPIKKPKIVKDESGFIYGQKDTDSQEVITTIGKTLQWLKMNMLITYQFGIFPIMELRIIYYLFINLEFMIWVLI